jgi:hypothetical protein
MYIAPAGAPDRTLGIAMFKRLLFGVSALIAASLVVVWLQPDDYRLTRQTTIAASAAEIFPYVNDLRRWDDWSPWAKLDLNAKVSFEGPPAGPGAMFHWSGNDKVGAGTMTITDSKANERVRTRADFMKPFEGTSDSEFIFSSRGIQNQGNQTEGKLTNVIWTMTGRHNFIGKAICLVMSMEATLGPDFEKGLMQLKQVAEKR